MSSYRSGVQPLVATVRFFVRRGWGFWIVAVLLGAGVALGATMYPQDLKGQHAADRLRDVQALPVDTVLWHVVDGYLEDVSVTVPLTDGTPFTYDLTGVEGHDEVESYDGWQPAHQGQGADDYLPGLRVRYLRGSPPVAMAEQDYRQYLGTTLPGWDLALVTGCALGLATLIGFTVRRDLLTVPPNRRTPYYRRARFNR